MNATADHEEDPELLTSGTAGLPLSAPVAASVLPHRQPSSYFRDAEGSPRPQGGLAWSPVPAQSAPAHRPAEDACSPGNSLPPAHGAPAHAPPAQPPAANPPAGHPAAADARAGADAHDRAAPAAPRAGSVLADWSADDPPEDPNRVLMRKHLDAVRVSAANASSWLETSVQYARLLNRDGVVPVTARFSREDIDFLGRAREQVLGFAELGLRLVELHAPLDAGGISTDPSSPILRCRSCMWRWPCPTFRMLAETLSHLPSPGSPPPR